MRHRNFIRFTVCWALIVAASVAAFGEWKSHDVRRLNGAAAETLVPAKMQIVTESWNRSVAIPYLAYMPEKLRLLMLVNTDIHRAAVVSSDDGGATWTKPAPLHLDAKGTPDTGMVTGLTYLGGGVLLAGDAKQHWWSRDYGKTWTPAPNPPAANGNAWVEWDPLLVTKDARTGQVERLMSFCSDNLQPDGHFQGYIRFSKDQGATWIDEIKVPQMYRVNEVAFLRAADGNIIGACRTDNPDRFKNEIDHYGGLGVSISKDEGRTWSPLSMLYEFGRHHPSMVLMPSGDIVMSYVVRKGYPDSPDGFPRFGIEAVVSRDHGRTWDLDHRYILQTWTGNRKRPADESKPGPQAWWASCQATSTVLLPDGNLLTAYGTWQRARLDRNDAPWPKDVGLVLWRVDGK